jgi:2-polyprenyl-3-methyl-5-hydroxy-6-metoxy-1,4-benzoquinol methylase
LRASEKNKENGYRKSIVMSYKNKLLLETEIQINESDLFYTELLKYSKNLNKQINEVKVLDWGCGRGQYVGFLLSKGFDAYGVEIDFNVLRQAKDLFELKNWNFEKRMKVVKANNSTEFPENFFDFIISDQVFEHVSNIDGIAAELYRITKSEGVQIHRWPSKFRIVEPHLFMPFVHWLPKGILRRGLICFFVLVGVEPKWQELANLSLWKKTSVYTEYSHKKTYYRSLSLLKGKLSTFQDVKMTGRINLSSHLFKKGIKKLKLNNALGLHCGTVILKLVK